MAFASRASWVTLPDDRTLVVCPKGRRYVPGLTRELAAQMRRRVLDRWGEMLEHNARSSGVPASWLAGVVWVESRGEPGATSPVGAVGLMQLYDPGLRAQAGPDPYDPASNVRVGAQFVARLRKRLGDLPRIASVYNCGGEADGTPHKGGTWVGAQGPGIWGYCNQGDYITEVVSAANTAREMGFAVWSRRGQIEGLGAVAVGLGVLAGALL